MGSLDNAVGAAPATSFEPTVPAYETDVVIDITHDDVTIDIEERGVAELLLTPRAGLLGASRNQLLRKRAIDIVGASVGMVLLAPVFCLLAIGVKLTSPGPVFYRRPRIGKDGEQFMFTKFRTMFIDADERKGALMPLNEVGGPIFKMKDDPRITPFGRFLRKTSLDELPQLMHVLSGKMSLVGVRPQLPEEVAQYTETHAQRLLVKPGLTCIWQVSGRSDLDFETWMQMDLEYIATWTPALDARLLFKTIGAVISGRGAY